MVLYGSPTPGLRITTVAAGERVGYPRAVSSTIDQQPIQRTVGRRQARDGQPLGAADRAAMTENARYLTRAPKGIFRYRSAEEMNADRQRWIVAAVVDRQP